MATYGGQMEQYQLLCCFAVANQSYDQYLFMNQQEKKIDGDKVTNPRHVYVLVGFGFALSIAIQWYAMAIIIFIWAAIGLRDAWRMKQMEEVRRCVKDYSWYSIHVVMKDSLEMLKCRRMIERGYDSRANTNIILQEEKQQTDPFILSPYESAITNLIIAISQKLRQLHHIKIEVFQQQQLSDIAISSNKIESFRELFSMNREIDRLIEELSTLEFLFESRMRQPLLDCSPRHHLVREGRNKILPLLAQIKQQSLNLQSIMDKEIEAMKLTPQFQSYLNIITKEYPSEIELQSLMAKIKHIQEQYQIPEEPQSIQTIKIQQSNEKSSQITKESAQNAQIERPSASQRCQFMKKLDRLLLVGLARRRQDQFQRKMRQLEQEQGSLIL